MTETVVSRDGTRIAYDVIGAGPPLVLVGGALCGREGMRPYAEALADRFAVVNYDRRGRGASGDTSPYSVLREVEDLAALVGVVGAAAVYGHSSGAALALHAAALPITALVLHEPPYSDEEPDGAIAGLVTEGRLGDAAAAHLRRTGVPAEVVEGMRSGPWWSWMDGNAATIPYDYEVLSARSRSGLTPAEQAASVRVPALVVAGGASAEWMIDVSREVAAAIPGGRHQLVPDHGHVVPPEVLAPILADFLA